MFKEERLKKENIEDILALTSMQEGILFHYLKNPGQDLYFEQLCLQISSPVDIDLFEKAWNFVIETNEILRTVFRWEKMQNPTQIVLKRHDLKIRYYDLTSHTSGSAVEIRNRDRKEKFDLRRVPFRVTLCKVDNDKHEIIISNHHILYDGWSTGIILREFFQTYDDLVRRKSPKIPGKGKFSDYLKWLKVQVSSKHEKFWKEYLAGFETRAEFSVKKQGGSDRAEIGNLAGTLRKTLSERIAVFIRENKITMAALLYTAFGLLMQKYNNCQDVIIGATVSGRSAKIKGIEDIAGLFINTLPLRIRGESEEKTGILIKGINEFLQEREEYESTPLVDISAYSALGPGEELFDTVLVIENYPLSDLFAAARTGLTVNSYSLFEMTNYDLTVTISISDEIGIGFIYNDERFEKEVIERLWNHFQNVLKEIVNHPGKEIGSTNFLSLNEKKQLLLDFNETEEAYPLDKTIHQLFEEQVLKTPDNEALVGKTLGIRSMKESETRNGPLESVSSIVEEGDRLSFTYGELSRCTVQLACLLKEKGVRCGGITAVLLERSIEMVVGILAILRAGGTYLPISPEYPEERKQYILKDSRAKVIITTRDVYAKMGIAGIEIVYIDEEISRIGARFAVPKTSSRVLIHQTRNIVETQNFASQDRIVSGENSFHREPPAGPAYVIYTSGSTGKPKGVVVEHRSVVNIISALQRAYPLGETDTYLFKTSYVFDVSVAELFGWFPGGGRLAVLEQGGEKEPEKIITAIENFCVTHINFVPSMFNVFVEELNERSVGRLAELKYIFLAGEALLPEFVGKFRKYNTGISLKNIYGPTEGTVYTSNYSLLNHKGNRNIPIGKPMQNIRLYILNRNKQLQPIGVPGELCISGDGVAAGYLNNPELTAERFIHSDIGAGRAVPDHTPAREFFVCDGQPQGLPLRHTPNELLYKTGDLALWLPEGNIEYLGRLDYQVKIRGFRIELGEIESRILKHEGIKDAVVLSRSDRAGDNYLCAYIVAKDSEPVGGNLVFPHDEGTAAPTPPHVVPSDLRQYLSRSLPDYMIPSYFVRIETLPLTPTGKVDRKVLPEPEKKAGKKYAPPRNDREKKLVATWGEILNREPQTVGIDDHFFELGGHSLKATRLLTKIHKEFDISVTLTDFFNNPTIRWVSVFIERTIKKENFVSIKATENKEYFPLSVTQKRFFFFQQLEPGTISYNMGEVLLMEGRVEQEKFSKTFAKLIHRHDSLRTSFELIDGKPVQKVHKSRDIEFAVEFPDFDFILNPESHLIDFEKLSSRFIRAFDLSCAPLLRVGLIRVEDKKYVLMVDMHHIISDGTSTGIFIADFLSIYKGEEQSSLRIRYRDYVYWMLGRIKKNRDSSTDMNFNHDDNADELLELPTDYMRPATQSFAGEKVDFEIGNEETQKLLKLSLREETTLFMLLFAIFNVFLSRLSGQENIVVGSPIAGRLHDDLEGIIGLFINTLAIRNIASSEKRFSRFMEEVRENSLHAFEEQEYQYEVLVEKIENARDRSRNPLFDVMFVMQNMDMPELEIPGLKIKRNLQEDRASKFDMTLYCEEIGDILVFKLEYCTKLFKSNSISRYITYFKNVISAVVTDPDQKIGEIDFITEKENREILYDFNDREVAYSREKTIYRMFEEQAARTPEKTALLQTSELYRHSSQEGAGIDGRYLTYRQLNERANRLARALRAKGVKTNSIVGIMLERSIELIEGLYAVLKAGGAYLPIDPEYPESRIISMLENSRAFMMLTGKDVARRKDLPAIPQEIVHIDDIGVDIKWSATAAADVNKQGSLSKKNSSPKNKIITHSSIEGQPGENLEPLSQPTDLIYVIFTSGSTGIPKETGVYQRSFVNLMNWFVTDFSLSEADNNLLITSFSFDLTQKNLYAPLILGGTLNLPAINYFDPGEILQEIEANNVTWINCTPSMFFQLIEFCKEDELKKLESLRYVYLGGEPISITMFLKWLESDFCHGEIVNTYGPTECTDISNSFRIREPRRYLQEPVPIGGPIFNVQLVVVDCNLKLLPVGFAGELLIAGESVGAGYINDRDLTERKFVRCSFEAGKSGRIYYRTGDLVKWLPDGTIEFIGRMDYQVKIRGFRIEIGEIENRLLDHDEIKEAVVIDRADDSCGKYLCAYFVSRGSSAPAASGLREYLSHTLPDYMIPSYFKQLEEMPLNPNGKVNRKALPAPEILSEKKYKAPRSDLEDKLAKIWSEVLGLEKGRIGIDDNFFELGGHSLNAAELTARIHQRLNVEIALKEIFRLFTIRGLSEYIGRKGKSHYMSITLAEKKEYYPLSSAPKRLYILQHSDPKETGYNIPAAFVFEGNLDREKFARTFGKLIDRHESIRTSFRTIEGEVKQLIHEPEDVGFKIELIESLGTGLAPAHDSSVINGKPRGLPLQSIKDSSDTIAHLIEAFIQPFDLSETPLFRAGILQFENSIHILMVDMHHIISDGISLEIFTRDFMTLYAGNELPSLNLQYKDYSEWQNSAAEKERIRRQEEYWLKQFAGDIPVLKLPYDYPRPPLRSYESNTLFFEINEEDTAALNKLTLDRATTLYMVCLAIYYVLMAKISGQDDIVIGTPATGRRHVDLEPLIGLFVNTQGLRNYPKADKSFSEFLQEVKMQTLGAFDNQDYPFEDLMEKLELNRDMSRNPLFDVMFSLQNEEITGITIPGLKLTPYEYVNKTSKFDLILMGFEEANRLVFSLEYSTKLFKKSTIERFIGYFKDITTVVLEDVDIKLLNANVTSHLVSPKSGSAEEASGDFGF
ncbi:amino acid adenylation domain-containing protein [Acidobacteriota bacterium]